MDLHQEAEVRFGPEDLHDTHAIARVSQRIKKSAVTIFQLVVKFNWADNELTLILPTVRWSHMSRTVRGHPLWVPRRTRVHKRSCPLYPLPFSTRPEHKFMLVSRLRYHFHHGQYGNVSRTRLESQRVLYMYRAFIAVNSLSSKSPGYF
ncbi:hypothetical protein J6590_009235 [Homalodisca vitripennis]|nr:hypothetical protein J6590_009235 [Homalodisca vitripennis]